MIRDPSIEAEARRKARIRELVDEITEHGDCCEHPTWRHKYRAASGSWRAVMVSWLVSQGVVLAYVLHPVVHCILRLIGVGCP